VTSTTRRRIGAETAFVVAASAAVAVVFLLHLTSAHNRLVVSDAALPLAAVTASVACLMRAWRCPRQVRATWILLGLAALSWGFGQTYSSWNEAVLNQSIPLPSPADAGYLGAVPLFAAALLRVCGGLTGMASRVRAVLDGLVVAASLLVVSWVFVLAPMVQAGASDAIAQVVGLAYPIGDVMVATIVIYASLHAKGSRRSLLPLAGIGAALVGLSFADSGFYILSTAGHYHSGDPIDTGWLFGWVALFVAARMARATVDQEETDDSTRPFGLLLPYGAVLAAIGTSAYRSLWGGGHNDKTVTWLRTAILLFLVARQVLTVRENRHLTDRLEQRVSERTEQLRASEHRFEALVKHSSDVVTLIDLDGYVRYQSESSLGVLGYRAEQLIGTTILDLLDESSQDLFRNACADVLQRPLGTAVVEVSVRRSDGTRTLLETRVTNLLEEPSVEGLVLNSRDISEQRKLERDLMHQAFHDPLTALANRALFQDRVSHALRRSAGKAGGVGVLFLDLDGFKEVNDSLGHPAGDSLLIEVAQRLDRCVDAKDTVARFGGDEFAILLAGQDGSGEAVTLARRIGEALSEPFLISEREMPIRASVGIALTEDAATTADQLMRNADLAMYRAKTIRRGSYVIYDPEMHAHLVERLELERDLRRAVREQQLEVYYQPTMAVGNGDLASFEALVRWPHADRGFVPPLTFIPLAEQIGLIHEIGLYVLTTACKQLVEWHNLYPDRSDLSVSVNISGRQLQRDDFVNEIAEVIRTTGIKPGALLLEITESVLLDDREGTLEKFAQLKAMGLRLAIDDFGTGYSSLSYLREFPVDVLKIDKSFVDELADGAEDKDNVVQTILQLGANLGMTTIAEGIEDVTQVDALRRMGCGYAQGFHLGRPAPADQIEQLIARQSVDRDQPAATG
jgi:diguanylate cyclase (GGDEF)-like protein/PAS domain S-box-containing protein